MEQNKFPTLDNLIHALNCEAKAGSYDVELTSGDDGIWNVKTGKIVYGFKSCVSKQYKNLLKFLNENNIKHNLINMRTIAIYKLVTTVYSMDEYRVMKKSFWMRGLNNEDRGKYHTNYILEINFNDLYY
jgi:hypothetical protein